MNKEQNMNLKLSQKMIDDIRGIEDLITMQNTFEELSKRGAPMVFFGSYEEPPEYGDDIEADELYSKIYELQISMNFHQT
jgi:hypothetical protein